MKEHRLVGAFALLIFAMCIAGTANAQTATTRVTPCSATTPNNAICVSWDASTVDTSGSTATPPAIRYRAEQRVGTAGLWATVGTNLDVTRYFAQNLAPGDYYFRVYANCVSVPGVWSCAEGGASNVATRSVATPTMTPSTPVIVIAATIRADAPPIYRIISTVKPKSGEVVFLVPESMRSLFASK